MIIYFQIRECKRIKNWNTETVGDQCVEKIKKNCDFIKALSLMKWPYIKLVNLWYKYINSDFNK